MIFLELAVKSPEDRNYFCDFFGKEMEVERGEVVPVTLCVREDEAG